MITPLLWWIVWLALTATITVAFYHAMRMPILRGNTEVSPRVRRIFRAVFAAAFALTYYMLIWRDHPW